MYQYIHKNIKIDVKYIEIFICKSTKTVNEIELSIIAYQTLKDIKKKFQFEIVFPVQWDRYKFKIEK